MLSAADVDAGKYFVMLSNAYRGDAPSAIFRDDWPDKPLGARAALAAYIAPAPAAPAAPPCAHVDLLAPAAAGIGNQLEGLARVAALADACGLAPIAPRAPGGVLARACARPRAAAPAWPAGPDVADAAKAASLRVQVRVFHAPPSGRCRRRCRRG